jgi:hypothetical protein
MAWNWNCVFYCFKVAQKQRIRGSDVPSFNEIRPFNKGFELSDSEPPHSFHLFSGVFFFSDYLISLPIFFLMFFIFLFLIILALKFDIVIFECSLFIFFKDTFEVIVILSSQYILVFLNEIFLFNLIILRFFLILLTFLDSDFDFITLMDELLFVLFFTEFLLFFL